MDNQLKSYFKAQFNSISSDNADPTILKGTVIIHGFEKSWNNQVITEEVCSENMHTLIGKRIVCKYISSEDNNGLDALKSHEEKVGKDREGNVQIQTDTIAIGFINNVYIDDYTDENGITKRVLYGEVTLWNDDKYSNVVGLLQEWLSKGIKVHMSVEYLYCNFNKVDGVEFLQSPILYVAHTLLNSETRNEVAEVAPAYDEAQLLGFNAKEQWNKAICQAIEKQSNSLNNDITNSKKEEDKMDNIFLKSLNELSHGDIRSKLITELSKIMTADEYYNVWISNWGVYDTYFIYENYENGKYVCYKVPYSKTETEVTVDYSQKVQVVKEDVWVEVTQMQEVQTSLNEVNTKVEELTTTLNEKEETIKSLNESVQTKDSEKQEITSKYEQALENITSLNEKIEEMKPIVEAHEQEQFEKELNSKIEEFKPKFEKFNALDKFESEEVQELIKKSVNSKEANIEIKAMIADLVTIEKDEQTPIKEFCSKQKNLIKVEPESFEDRYGFLQ